MISFKLPNIDIDMTEAQVRGDRRVIAKMILDELKKYKDASFFYPAVSIYRNDEAKGIDKFLDQHGDALNDAIKEWENGQKEV